MTKEDLFIDTILSLKDIPQSPKWHPEGDTFEHIKFIMYGLTYIEEIGSINADEAEFLHWVALFHDLGKIDTLTFDEEGNPHAYGHEKYAKRYIEKFEDLIPDWIDIDKLKKFCRWHMKAHQYMGTQMREVKKEMFRDSFEERDFYLLMIFESCDSSLTLYETLRRTAEHLRIGYLEPIEFYDSIRGNDNFFTEEDVAEIIKLMINRER